MEFRPDSFKGVAILIIGQLAHTKHLYELNSGPTKLRGAKPNIEFFSGRACIKFFQICNFFLLKWFEILFKFYKQVAHILAVPTFKELYILH